MRIVVESIYIWVIVFLLSGCATLSSLNPFSSSKKSVVRNPPATLIDFKPSLTIRSAWMVPVGNASTYAFSPALVNDSLFVAGGDGLIMKIDPSTGHILWRIDAQIRLTAGVGSDGTTIAVAGEKGLLLAFDAEGKLRWKVQTSSEILSVPAVGQGLVIVRSMDNHIAAFDAMSGERRWIVQRNAPSLSLRSSPGLVIARSTVFVALSGGRLLALSLSNGGPRWEVAIGEPRGATELERVSDISGAPVVDGNNVCVVAYQGRMVCLDADTGVSKWMRELSSEVGLGLDERFLFAIDDKGAVMAFTRDTGVVLWRNSKLLNRGLSTPLSFGRTIIVGDKEGYIHFLSREDGSLLARIPTDGSSIISISPLIAGSLVIFQTHAGKVIALAME